MSEKTLRKQKGVKNKAECRELLKGEDVLKDTMVGNNYYAAIRIKDKYKDKDVVYCTVIKTYVNNNDYFNFGYKIIDDVEGPAEAKCPVSILKLLSEPINEYSKNWRERCYKYNEDKKHSVKLSDVEIGQRIRYTNENGIVIELVKMQPTHQFKTPWYYYEERNIYVSKSRIPSNFEIVK